MKTMTWTEKLEALTFANAHIADLSKRPAAKVQRAKHQALRAQIIAALGWKPEGAYKDGEDYLASTSELARWADAEVRPNELCARAEQP